MAKRFIGCLHKLLEDGDAISSTTSIDVHAEKVVKIVVTPKIFCGHHDKELNNDHLVTYRFGVSCYWQKHCQDQYSFKIQQDEFEYRVRNWV